MNNKTYISIPFSIQEEKIDISTQYNSNIFIQNNFYRNITFDFYIGNPPQKVNGIILNDNLCFELKVEKELYSYNNFFNNINNKYKPKESSSFSVINKELRWNKGQYMTLGADFFKFGDNNENYNLTFLFNRTEKEIIDIDELKNEKYIVKFGLNIYTGFSGDECPNFLIGTKQKAKLSKYLLSFVFINSYNGYLVFGDELYNYNPKIYHESQHLGVYTTTNCPISYNKEIIMDIKNNKNITLNRTHLYIEYDLGVIIGTNKYKQVIDDIFFNKLILDGICEVDKVKLNSTNDYYIYRCNEKNLNLENFPKIIFNSRIYRFDFELNYSDLFIKKPDNKYYFLILFKVNNETNTTNIKENWRLGEPFYKKYNFTLNLDARMLGFYNPNFDFVEEKEIHENSDKNKNENKDITSIIIFSVLGSIFVVLLMFLSFYLGMKIKEGRKKRANELKEDNYDYFPDTKNEENKLFN